MSEKKWWDNKMEKEKRKTITELIGEKIGKVSAQYLWLLTKKKVKIF